jgi:hypothetical protein
VADLIEVRSAARKGDLFQDGDPLTCFYLRRLAPANEDRISKNIVWRAESELQVHFGPAESVVGG